MIQSEAPALAGPARAPSRPSDVKPHGFLQVRRKPGPRAAATAMPTPRGSLCDANQLWPRTATNAQLLSASRRDSGLCARRHRAGSERLNGAHAAPPKTGSGRQPSNAERRHGHGDANGDFGRSCQRAPPGDRADGGADAGDDDDERRRRGGGEHARARAAHLVFTDESQNCIVRLQTNIVTCARTATSCSRRAAGGRTRRSRGSTGAQDLLARDAGAVRRPRRRGRGASQWLGLVGAVPDGITLFGVGPANLAAQAAQIPIL